MKEINSFKLLIFRIGCQQSTHTTQIRSIPTSVYKDMQGCALLNISSAQKIVFNSNNFSLYFRLKSV